jgi:hypothetical protein
MPPSAEILESPMPIEENIATELAAHVSREALVRRDRLPKGI